MVLSYYTVLGVLCAMSVACGALLGCCFWRLQRKVRYYVTKYIASEPTGLKEC